MLPKRIGVLSSGGDAPGMNAAIRTVVRAALAKGIEVFGIQRGYSGLLNDLVEILPSRSVGDIVHRGGTILKTARSEEFITEAGQEKAVATLRRHGIDGLVVIGGDGSFRGARDLTHRGIATVGIPATIDNDIASTDFSIGFDTAINTVVEAINKIRDTAESHERTYVIEVMGRDSGFIALFAGVAGGVEMVLVPERPTKLSVVKDRVLSGQSLGKTRSIIVVAEGFHPTEVAKQEGQGAGMIVGNYIRQHTGLETRITILGHLQRGGSPSAFDRILASRLAFKAVEVLCSGNGGKVVGLIDNKVQVFDIDEALAREKGIDEDLYSLADVLASL